MSERVTAWAAATVANLGPGFDVLGLCLEGPRDAVSAELTGDAAVEIVEITGDGGRLSPSPRANVIGVVAERVLTQFAPKGVGVRLWLDKGLPLGSGLGSSAASSVAAALATARLVDPTLPKAALLDACREGERLAAGSPHPDNVAPCLFGGLVACLPGPAEAVDVLRLELPDGLVLALVKPDYDVPTTKARALLPTQVPMADAVHNLAHVAGLVTAFAKGDLDLVARCLDAGDRLSTPHRKALIPQYDAVVAAAKASGAIGAGISGSGSTCFALTDDREAAIDVADAMVAAFAEGGARAHGMISAVDPEGAFVERVR